MTKQGEIDYPLLVDKEHLYLKPFDSAHSLREFVDIYKMISHKKGKLLELGGGSGGFSYLFSKCGYQVTCIDISPKMIEIAQGRFSKDHSVKINFFVKNMEKVSFDNQYDVVIIHDALHHCPNYKAVMKNAFRSLKSGGEFVLSEPSLLHLFSPRARKASRAYNVTELGFSRFILKRCLRKIGFSEVYNFYPGIASYGSSLFEFLLNVTKLLFSRFLFPPKMKILMKAIK